MLILGDITITKQHIDTATGADLDAIAARLNLLRKPVEADCWFRSRALDAYVNHPDRTAAEVHESPRRIKWKEGVIFIKKGQDPDSPALYKVLHPGQLGGDVMFVVRLDTGEESLYSKDLHPVIIDNQKEIDSRILRADFALIINRVQNEDMPMHAAFAQARCLFTSSTKS